MQLADKVAVITGAARGLGRAYAEALAAEGAAIVAADLNDCGETVAAVESASGRALSTTVDVESAAAPQHHSTAAPCHPRPFREPPGRPATALFRV